MFVFQCQSCGHKKVSVVDFLKVRDNELVKGGDIYPYEKFREFSINIWRGENDISKGISYNKMYGFIKQIKEEYHITEEDLKIVEGKYDIKFPEILRSYYLEHNGDIIKTCYLLVDDYSYGIAKIVQLKNGTTTFEYIVDNDRKDGIIDENMFPIARNEGGDYYYWNKQTQNIYLYYCDDIEDPIYICENINSFFEIMDKSCIV